MQPSSTPPSANARTDASHKSVGLKSKQPKSKQPKSSQPETLATIDEPINNDHEDGHEHKRSSPHVHSEASQKRIINRLSRIEGHLRGIKTMVQDNRPCPEVLIQIAAVRGGIDGVARSILDEHLSQCITRAVDEGNIEAEVAALKAALDRFI